MRLTEGVSIFQLAANIGTSVEMLEDFYGKKRMRDPKMATEVTKNRSSARSGDACQNPPAKPQRILLGKTKNGSNA
jgi:hypothetical protein